MSIKIRLLVGAMAAFVLASCVTTTSGPPRPEPDNEAAAIQYYQLGARYYKAGKFDVARDRLERALEFDPKMANAHSILALTYQELDIPRLAKKHFELAVRSEPRNFDARNTYAIFLCQQREFKEAREQFERAIRIPENDDSELMMTNAGVCMVQKPDLVDAEAYFRRALTEKRNYPEALLQMALLKRQTGDPLGARAFLQRYMAANAVSAAILYLALQIEKDNGDARASMDYSNQLLRDFPASAEAKSLTEAG